jgi:NAD(P)-dependent dehydrogenase (short-subunit alcohol dehydrogenase family)
VKIKNSSIVVAGATTGIGPALCAGLARSGARLGLVDLDRDRGMQLTAQLSDLTICTFRHGDLSVPAEAGAVVRSLAAALAGIDAFVMLRPEGAAWEPAAAEAVRHRRFPGRPVDILSAAPTPAGGGRAGVHRAAVDLLYRLQSD